MGRGAQAEMWLGTYIVDVTIPFSILAIELELHNSLQLCIEPPLLTWFFAYADLE